MLEFLEKHRRAVVAVLFLILAAAGLLMLPRRASGLDEEREICTLQINMKAYADLLLPEDSGVRQFLKEDADIDEWVDKEYGQARSYAVWPLMYLADSEETQQDLYHYHIYLVFLLGLYALYRIVWRLTGSWKWGLAGMALLLINPRFFGDAFCNNKDSMLLSLCLVVFWLGLQFIEKVSWKSCVWFGIAGAFAANARAIGLGAFGLCGILYLAYLTLYRKWNRRAFLRGALAVSVFLLTFYIITPACWHDFFGFWQYYLGATSNFDAARWNGWVLYRGAVYNPTENPIPWHYIPWFMAITTPLLILALAVLWPVMAVVRCGKQKEKWISPEMLFCYMLCLFAGLPLLYAMIVRPNLYNGWRHFYFIYSTVVILAAVSAFWLWQSRRKWVRTAVTVAVAANLVYYAGFIGVNFPNEYAYFNVLAGEHPEQSYDADYWNLSAREAIITAMQTAGPDTRIADQRPAPTVRGYWYGIRDQYPELFGERAEEVTWDRRARADCVLGNTSYWAIEQLHHDWEENQQAMEEWVPLINAAPVAAEVKCGRTVLWRLYENPQYKA